MDVIGNRLLSDYAQEEINTLQNGAIGFKLGQSTPTILGGNPAQKIVYTSSLVKNGVIAGTRENMEIMTIREGVAYFIVYATTTNNFPTLLPIVNKMVESFEFKPLPSFLQ